MTMIVVIFTLGFLLSDVVLTTATAQSTATAKSESRRLIPTIKKDRAVSFLRRHKRSIAEECREGCFLEELLEHYHNNWDSHSYMRRYKCEHTIGSFCTDGCTNTNYDYSHIDKLSVGCIVNGHWSGWSSWGGCSPVCGRSYRQRQRTCNNPPPRNGGSSCQGLSWDQEQCDIPCSWMNRWCWPGTCTNSYICSCSCMSGFKKVQAKTTAICQPQVKPKFDSCQTRAFGMSGSGEVWSNMGSPKCDLQKDLFGRFQIDHFVVNLMANFIVHIEDIYNNARPKFVESELFGVTAAAIGLTKQPVTGALTTIERTTMKINQLTATFANNSIKISNRESLSNGEKLCLTFYVNGGGFLVSKNLHTTSHATNKIDYDQTENSKQLCYIYDRMVPIHCFERHNCYSKPMAISKRLTRSRRLFIDVDGWFDPFPTNGDQSLASGIESFEINIYEVKESNLTHLMQGTKTLWNITHNSSTTKFDIILPDKNPMLYVIFLDVKDRANNVRQARRLVLYDKSSTFLRNEGNPLLVTTATNKSDFKWQIRSKKLCFSWKGRFYNDKLKGLLRPVKPERNINKEYDQISGELPINGTRHVNGTTTFYYLLINERRNAIIQGLITNLTSESKCFLTETNDGDIFTFNVQARDIMNNTLNDSVSVNIDTSVPEIVNIWLVREGHQQLFVHHSSDLSLMTITFKAFDIHSGLREVKWAFGDYENKTVLIEKAVSVNDCLNSTDCYCPVIGNCSQNSFQADLTKMKIRNNHIGNHNRRYYFTIKVVNNARLVAVEHIDILVDESPPEVGVVSEGPVGSPDIDYTRLDDVTISWNGFLDHESGIKSYRVSLARTCLFNLKDIPPGRYNDSQVLETYHKSIKIAFPDGQGKYYATVIAFNHAMSPSPIVCSDGITFDKSTPKINNIRIKHAFIAESIGCMNQEPYHIMEDLTTVELIGDTCLRRCINKADDNILTVLPRKTENKTDSTSIHSFLCINVKQYTKDTIYTPSDLFDITWDMTEDKSQIASSYIGFGRDVSAINSPDIIPYTNQKHNTNYFQRHPGLVGEREIYVFVKVVNRAGLERKAWLGPILADETPPICPLTVNSSVEDDHFTIKWSSKHFLDTEQSEEIGKILFRLGTANRLITPYMEWNIKSHGDQCGSKWRCIKFPVYRLQKHDTIDGMKFFMQLHVYNYAGHYCSVNSSSIRLPSLFPPREGVVMDILPGDRPPYSDIDVKFDLDVYCFSWKGFDHHENVQLQAGLGTSKKSDDVLSFHDITSITGSFLCERLMNTTTEKRYFVTIKATCSGGTTYMSSDGFTILNKADVISSLTIFHGSTCQKQTEISKINSTTFSRDSIKLHLSGHLVPGSSYYFLSTFKTELLESNNPIHVVRSEVTNMGSAISFTTFDSIDWLIISNANYTKTSSEIHLYRCNPDIKTQMSTSVVPIHWTIPALYQNYVTHYQTGICGPIQDDTECDETIFSLSGNTTQYNFSGNFKYGWYKTGVKPCFGRTCLQSVWSSGLTIQKVTEKVQIKHVSGVPEETCLKTDITFDRYLCSNENATLALGYRWGIFNDGNGRNMVSEWRSLKSKFSSIKDSECFQLPIHLHRALYACVEPFCEFGTGPSSCRYIQQSRDPNKYSKDILYDLNLNNPVAKSMKQYEHSINIGDNLRTLHDIEMDFADQNVHIGGYLLQNSGTIEWYLMKVPSVPQIQCSRDLSCLAVKKTTAGFVDFKNHGLKEIGMFYLCARVYQSLNATKAICSDGFLIDNSLPKGGNVLIDSSNGFVVDGSSLNLRWSEFKGNVEASRLGYPSEISAYEYALGTHPGSSDVQMFTTAGLSLGKTINNIHLRPGQAYYATVRAYNHLNKSVDSVSKPVIFDDTPPYKGRIKFRSNGMNGFVTADKLFVEWFDVVDDESGIQSIELGIGSSNISADIVPLQNYIDFADISSPEGFQDGHRYFAILQATNRAGLTSHTISDPVILDRSPPEIGHVLDVLTLSNAAMHDVDYQTDTTSITVSWYGFYDSHSDISEYKVGLGSFPGNDDIMQFSTVGLQTEKKWFSNFQQGVKYFSTVEACNNAGLCSRSTSNGVIIDNSAPIPGMVFVGDDERHSRYLSDRKILHMSWIGFQDPHSDIEHFDVCISTKTKTCDVMERWNAHLSSSFIKSNLDLPIWKMMFVTVRACNNVGMCSEMTSPSFIIDETPPRLIMSPCIVSPTMIDHGSHLTITDPSFFKVTWQFNDTGSPIVRTTISMRSKLESHIPIDIEELSNENEFVFHLSGDEILRLGDVYNIEVTACNAAKLCTTAISSNIIVDYTTPQLGGFMPPLLFQIKNGTLSLNLTWYGFIDTESDIKSYFISVGYTYSGVELLDNHMFLPNITSFGNGHQGNISVPISGRLLDHLVLTVWAENFAGLRTPEAKVTTDVVSTNTEQTKGNMLIQKHSCIFEYCNNDCTCAVIGKQCRYDSNLTCFESTSKIKLNVDVTLHADNTKANVMGSSKCLSVLWSTKGEHINILRYEYSFGILGENVGHGVYNLSVENAWQDNGHKTNASYCLSKGFHLRHQTSYVAHVRAWISFSEYLTFTSRPVIIDHSPPDIHKRHFVLDSDTRSCNDDVDYVANADSVYACWENVFDDKESEIQRFMVSLGTAPSMDDVRSRTEVGTNTHIEWTGVALEPGIRYYTTVTAVSSIGLTTSVSSDGFMVDDTKPEAGIVYNTGEYHNTIFQSPLSPVKFSWHGFTDQHSFIESYHIAYAINDEFANESLHFKDIGITNNIRYNTIPQHGDQIVAIVKARDKSGHESNLLTSPPIHIDGTPPTMFQCETFEIKVNHTEKMVHNDNYNFNKNLFCDKHDVLKIEVYVSKVRLGFRGNIKIDDISLTLPFSVHSDRSVVSSYIYVSHTKKLRTIEISLMETESNSIVNISISKCSNLTTDNNIENVMTKQLSEDSLSICIPTIDKESGIKQISIQVGTMPSGCEIQTLHPIASHLHATIKGNFTHGMNIFIKADVENHAGLHSVFTARPLIIDHTEPQISIKSILPKYETLQNSSQVRLESTLEVVDEESDVHFCEYCFGLLESSCGVIEWTPTSSLSSFKSATFSAVHGSKLFGDVRCINSVGLVGVAYFGPIMISYEPPITDDSKVQFITDSSSDAQSQGDLNSVTLKWDEFRDMSDVDTYYVSSSSGDSKLRHWHMVGKRNYLQISGLSGIKGQLFEVAVKGRNTGGAESSIVNNSILLDETRPIVTGKPVKIYHKSGNDFLVTWLSVFTSVDNIREFQVSVGTTDGSTDILMPTMTTDCEITVYVPEHVTYLYCVITATLSTDVSSTYRYKVAIG